MELNKLIEEVKKDGKMTSDDINKYLVNAIEEGYKPEEVMKNLYKISFGNKLSDSLCRDWVMCMDVTDGSGRATGEKWNISQTTDVGSRLSVDWTKMTKYEWYAALNMAYSDFFHTGKEYEIEQEADFYASLAMDMFCRDSDSHDKTLFNYYFNFIA